MARIVALARTHSANARIDMLRSLIVCGCALALILAKTGLPL